jgi:hypothetical protein
MIFYGTRSSIIKEEKINYQCSYCESNNTTRITVYRKYFHIYLIPFFSLGKDVFSDCSHCKQSLSQSKMDMALEIKAQAVKSTAKTPMTSYTGLFLLIGASLLGVYFYMNAKDDTELYAKSPLKGDRYYYETGEGDYSCMKINTIDKDSIFFLDNTEAMEKKYNVYKIDKDEKYDTSLEYGYSKVELQGMLKDGTIYKIKR